MKITKNNLSNPKDFVSGIGILLFGVCLTFKSIEFPVWIDGEPQEGFFPLFAGITIIFLSIIVIYGSISKAKQNNLQIGKKKQVSTSNHRKMAIYAISMTLYGFMIKLGGFLFSTVIFLFIILKFVERQNWRITILVSILSSIASYFIFSKLLAVPLPKGLFGF